MRLFKIVMMHFPTEFLLFGENKTTIKIALDRSMIKIKFSRISVDQFYLNIEPNHYLNLHAEI